MLSLGYSKQVLAIDVLPLVVLAFPRSDRKYFKNETEMRGLKEFWEKNWVQTASLYQGTYNSIMYII